MHKTGTFSGSWKQRFVSRYSECVLFLGLPGTIPGPITFGTAFDGACLQFEERCDDSGTCLLYDNQQMALYLFIVCVSVKGASLLLILFAWKTYKPPKRKSPPAKPLFDVPAGNYAINPAVTYGLDTDKTEVTDNGFAVQNGKVTVVDSSNGIVSPVFVSDEHPNCESTHF